MRSSPIRDPRLWRFCAADHPAVARYLLRDIDAAPTRREQCAVREWLVGSGKGFHVMRDHPGHSWPMLAGMWGGRRRLVGLAELLVAQPRAFHADQTLLQQRVWPAVRNDSVQHDAFHCHSFEGAFGFPSARGGAEHVGATLINGSLEASGVSKLLKAGRAGRRCARADALPANTDCNFDVTCR